MLNRRSAVKLFALSAAVCGLSGITIQKENRLNYCLGKSPARPHDGLKLRDYVTSSKLPVPPDNYGRETLIADWGMLGNDTVGDCAIAGPFHAEMLWRAEGASSINVNTACTLEQYSEITGYRPEALDPRTRTNPTDQGSDVQKVAEFWRTTGLKDADGNRHKIDCYLSLEPGNLTQLYQAMWLFGCVGIGIDCPAEYMQSFYLGQVWDKIPTPHIEGGHYILGVGRRAGLINTVTWGRTQLFTPAGYQQFNDETFVYLNEEMLIKGESVDGFNVQQLVADMADIESEGAGQPYSEDCPTEPIPLISV